jgi:hypothetical protein
MKRLLIGALIAGTIVAAAALIGSASASSPTAVSSTKTIHMAVASPAAPPVYYKGQQINLAGGKGANLKLRHLPHPRRLLRHRGPDEG